MSSKTKWHLTITVLIIITAILPLSGAHTAIATVALNLLWCWKG